MIVTDGGRFGGYGLYVLKGKPVFTYNLLALEKIRWEGQEPLTAWQAYSRIRFQVRRARHGEGRQWRLESGWQGG